MDMTQTNNSQVTISLKGSASFKKAATEVVNYSKAGIIKKQLLNAKRDYEQSCFYLNVILYSFKFCNNTIAHRSTDRSDSTGCHGKMQQITCYLDDQRAFKSPTDWDLLRLQTSEFFLCLNFASSDLNAACLAAPPPAPPPAEPA